MAWMRVRIPIPKGYKPQERQAIAQEIIEHIIERTEKGLDKENKKFAPYSKSYKSSLNFKIAGKGQNVDLTLTGEMLNSLKLLSDSSDSLLIGFDKEDKTLNGKAEGNIKGTYGNKKPVTKGRDFLGIKSNDLDKVLDKYPLDNEAERLKNLIIASRSRQKSSDILQGADYGEDDT